MKNILVVTPKDPKDTSAIKKGMYLASLTGARLDIIEFCHEQIDEIADDIGTGRFKLKQEIMQHKRTQLEEAIAQIQQTNKDYNKLKINPKVVWENHIYEWIIKTTSENNYDLVVKTGRRSETVFYTPVDFHLMRGCYSPVYLITQKKWKKKSRILVALDIESKKRTNSALMHSLLGTGRMLADAMNAELDCCFVVHIPEVLKELDAVDISTYSKKARDVYLPRVIKLVEPYGIEEDNIYKEVGKPASRIQKIANKLKVDVLVIGMIGRKGLSSKLVGNTAESVLKHLYTDMVVVNCNIL